MFVPATDISRHPPRTPENLDIFGADIEEASPTTPRLTSIPESALIDEFGQIDSNGLSDLPIASIRRSVALRE